MVAYIEHCTHEEDWKDCKGGGTDEDADRDKCQSEDDYCDTSEGCHETYIDCVDDVNKGDDGEDEDGPSNDSEESSSNDNEEEGNTIFED